MFLLFWRTHNQAELDLFVPYQGKKLGFEFKYTDRPSMTKSMHIALEDLALEHLYVIYPGEKTFPLAERATAIGLAMWMEKRSTLI